MLPVYTVENMSMKERMFFFQIKMLPIIVCIAGLIITGAHPHLHNTSKTASNNLHNAHNASKNASNNLHKAHNASNTDSIQSQSMTRLLGSHSVTSQNVPSHAALSGVRDVKHTRGEGRRNGGRSKRLPFNHLRLYDVRMKSSNHYKHANSEKKLPVTTEEEINLAVKARAKSSSANDILAAIGSRIDPSASRPDSGTGGVDVVIDGDQVTGTFDHFWRSTGLCPPDPHSRADTFLLGLDEKLNLALVGSLPHDAVRQVRIHWLLDLVQGRLEGGQPTYNFSHLDALLDHLWRHQLRPGFELMGNPGNIFTDFENKTQVLWWRHLVALTARRYADRYGLEWVASWKWESWNEPDHHDFDNLNFTLAGFLNYFDSCRAGLDDVTDQLILGGPGGSCRDPSFSHLCWALLGHCDRGSSFFTPGRPPRIDFISFHKKGQEDADSILTQELETIEKIRRNYPHLRHVPIVNDEGDFLKGWWRGRSWRADGRYAGLVARAVYTHYQALTSRPHLNYQLISFDNAFLNYFPNFFEQRSLMARFQINTTLPRQAQLIKKDAYSVLALLSLLGDHVLSSTEDTRRKGLSVISTCRGCKKDASQESISIERFPDSPSKEPPVTEGLPDTPSQRSNNSGKQYEATPTQALTKDLEPENNFTASPQNPRENTTENFPRERPTDDRTTPPPEDQDEIRLHFGNETDHQTPLNLTTTPNENTIPRERHEASSKKADLSSRGAGASAWEAAVLVARSDGTRTSREGVQVKVVLVFPKEVLGERLAVVTYQLGGKHKGPYEAWIDLGRPVEPSRKELAFIRSHEGGRRDGPRFLVASHNNLTMTMTMLVPDVTLMHVCQVFGGDPGQVTDVKALAVTRADLLLTWSDSLIKTRCVFGYQVERSEASRDGPYFSLTRRLLHHNNYFHSLPVLNGSATVQGWYRVRVVTYWGTAGAFSRPIFHHVG